jgi:hypothetical protein
MKIINGTLVREQNPNDVDDSCFDSSECRHMTYIRCGNHLGVDIKKFLVNGTLERHPQTNWPNDMSSDQEHMWMLTARATFRDQALTENIVLKTVLRGYRTSNKNLVSLGYFALIKRWTWLSNLLLIGQIILFWIPVRWNDGNGSSRLQFGYRHHCGDYRLFKQCLYYAPWIIRRMVLKSTLKKMTRYYWEPEPNVEWLIQLDDEFVENCL